MPEESSENGEAGVESECSELWDAFAGVLENLPAENLNNIVRDLDELEERWNNSLTFGGPLTKFYLDGRLDIVVLCARANEIGHYYVVIRAKNQAANITTRKLRYDALGNSIELDRISNLSPYNCECFVLLGDVQIMKQTKVVVPSLAWVQPVNNIANILAGSLYFSDRTGWQTVGLGEDREAGLMIGYGIIDKNRLVDQMIERRSEIVDAIPDDQAPLDWDSCLESLAANLRLVITDKQVRATLRRGADALAKIVDVMYGPFDLSSGPKKNV